MIRLARPADAAGVLAIYAPVVRESHSSFEIEPPTEGEMRARIEGTLAMFPWLVFERDGQLAGYAHAGIALPDAASVRLHESAGFTPVGIYREAGYKLGAWRDTGWWQCRVGDSLADPVAPIPLSQLGPGILDQL